MRKDYLDKFAKLLRPCGINYELDPELDKRSRDAEIGFAMGPERLSFWLPVPVMLRQPFETSII